MLQLAWGFLVHQQDSMLAAWYRARTADARGATRKTMIVALARKLLIVLWRLATTGEVPDGVALRAAVRWHTCGPGRLGFCSSLAYLSLTADDDPRWRQTDMAWPCTPRFRMGPPPRSFAADAYDCIMVRLGQSLPDTDPMQWAAKLW
jgi:hypothetical protein